MDEAGFPPGVLNLAKGSRDVADALLQNKDVMGVSFVGSTPVAKYVYSKATASGKRAQCQGGAKNFLLVMADALLDPSKLGYDYLAVVFVRAKYGPRYHKKAEVRPS